MNGILGGLKTKSRLKVRDRISGFLPIQGSSSGWKSVGHPNSFLVPLKNGHLWSFERIYEIQGGPYNFHIIIHGWSRKLLIPCPTPYKQCTESSWQFRVQSAVQSPVGSSESSTEWGVCKVWDKHFFRSLRQTFFRWSETDIFLVV